MPFFKYPAPPTDHQPFPQLGEVVREAGPVHNKVVLIIILNVDGGDRGGVVNMLDLVEERGEAA